MANPKVPLPEGPDSMADGFANVAIKIRFLSVINHKYFTSRFTMIFANNRNCLPLQKLTFGVLASPTVFFQRELSVLAQNRLTFGQKNCLQDSEHLMEIQNLPQFIDLNSKILFSVHSPYFELFEFFEGAAVLRAKENL